MKKILIIPILLLVLSSCNKDTSNLNIDTKHASSAPAYALFSNGQRNLADVLATPNVNINIFQLITQQWTEVTYVDESNYDLGTRNISNNWWRAMYKTVLINLEAAKAGVPKDVVDADEQFENVYWGFQLIENTEYDNQAAEVRAFTLIKLQSVLEIPDLSIAKSEIGYPVVLNGGTPLDVALSFAHHDRFVGYSFKL